MSVLRQEVSQCRVPLAQAFDAGPVHRAFLDSLPAEWLGDPDVEVFSRLLWLRAGWYPLRPSFHLDWGPTYQFQGRVETLAACFGTPCAAEFVDEPFELGGAPEDALAAGASGGEVEALVEAGKLRTTRLEGHQLYYFDNRAWHRAMPARATGWRMLVRAIRGLDEARRHRGPEIFTSVRNDYIPITDEEKTRHAPYADQAR